MAKRSRLEAYPAGKYKTEAEGGWFEVPLRRDWIAAYRVRVQNGEPIFAELRIFPAEGTKAFPPGEWQGSKEQESEARVPLHGLDTSLIRTLKVQSHRSEGFRQMEDLHTLLIPTLRDLGVPIETLKPRVRQGRPRKSVHTLAEIAAAYCELIQRGNRKPVQTLAVRLKKSQATLRDQIHEARRLGILSRPPPGIAGGHLTDKGRRLIAELKAQREARKGKRGKK